MKKKQSTEQLLNQQTAAYKKEKIQKNIEWQVVARRAHTRTDEQEEEGTKLQSAKVQSVARRQQQGKKQKRNKRNASHGKIWENI